MGCSAAAAVVGLGSESTERRFPLPMSPTDSCRRAAAESGREIAAPIAALDSLRRLCCWWPGCNDSSCSAASTCCCCRPLRPAAPDKAPDCRRPLAMVGTCLYARDSAYAARSGHASSSDPLGVCVGSELVVGVVEGAKHPRGESSDSRPIPCSTPAVAIEVLPSDLLPD